MPEFYDAFISYGRADSKAFALNVCDRLSELGYRIWFDFNDIPLGVNFQTQINDGIERAHNFLFIIAPHSVNSTYCAREIEQALSCNKRIIPLLHVEEIERDIWQQRHPDGTDEQWLDYQAKGLHSSFSNLHPEIGKINWVYVREGLDDVERSLSGLVDIFERHKRYVENHTRLLTQALEWERNQKQTRYLLIQQERIQAEDWLTVRFKDEQPPCAPTDLHCEFITESKKNAHNLMCQVFLAHAEEDAAAMAKIRRSLLRQGITVWTSSTDIRSGEDFRQSIERGIEQADNLIYLLSPDAQASEFCQHELNYALTLNKRIIPILVAPVAEERIPPALKGLQYIDLSDNECDEDYQLDESQLLKRLKEDATYFEEHKVLLVQALKWDRQQRNPSALLRGYNLRHAEAWWKLAQTRSTHTPTALQVEFLQESLRQPPAQSLDVFISYSRADSDVARQLNDALQIQGKRTWFDQESIASGTDFQQEIHRGIETSGHFLFIISPESVRSPYCVDEVEYAQRLNKRIVTVLHRPVKTEDLHPVLAAVQWIDFRHQHRDFNSNFKDLLRTLDTDREHLETHTRLLVRAIEWDDKGRKESLLLRDDELTEAEKWLVQSLDKEPKSTELQQSYVKNSRAVEDANQKATQILKTATKRAKRLVWLAGGVGFLIAGVASTLFWQSQNQLKIANMTLQMANASEKLQAGQQFQALIYALESGQNLSGNFRKNSYEWNTLQLRIIAVLQQIMGEIREKNSFEGHQYAIRNVAFSPDGKMLASASDDYSIRLWDMETGHPLNVLEGHQDAVWSVNFSLDGKKIVSGGWDNTIKVWDVETGRLLNTFERHKAEVVSVSFSPNMKMIVSGSWDSTIKIWDAETGQLLNTLEGHQYGLKSVSFNPDNTMIVSGSFDGTIKLWNVETGQLIKTFEGHQGGIGSISFSKDGEKIVSGGWDSTIKIWNVVSGQLLDTLEGHQDEVLSISISPDEKTIASSSSDQTIKLWNIETGQLIENLRGHQSLVLGIAFSPDGKVIASGGHDNTIKIWDIAVNKQLTEFNTNLDGAHSFSFSPDGRKITSSSYGGDIYLWDVVRGQLLHTLGKHQSEIASSSFSPDGKTIISGGDNTIKLWDTDTGKLLDTLSAPQDGIIDVDFSSDNKTIAVGNLDGTINVWDVEARQLLNTFEGHQDSVMSIRFSPNGKTIVSGSWDHTIKKWDVETGDLLDTLEGHKNSVISIRISPNGKMIASGSVDNTIKLWNAETGKLTNTLEGHQDVVVSISFSPDSKMIASGSNDSTIRVWDTETGKILGNFEANQGEVYSVSFSPDGKTLVSGHANGVIKIWMLDFSQIMTTGCNWIRQYLITHPNKSYLCEGYLTSDS